VSGDLVLYPARVVGTVITHLAATEKQPDELLPQLVPVCPAGRAARPQLELVPEGDLCVWCQPCADYAADLGASWPGAEVTMDVSPG
jgi:hypothetical protein